MCKLSERYQIDRRILKCDYKRYSPREISTIDTANSQIYIYIYIYTLIYIYIFIFIYIYIYILTYPETTLLFLC